MGMMSALANPILYGYFNQVQCKAKLRRWVFNSLKGDSKNSNYISTSVKGGSLTLQGGLSFVPMVLEYSEKIGGGWDRLGILCIQNMYIILYEVFVK